MVAEDGGRSEAARELDRLGGEGESFGISGGARWCLKSSPAMQVPCASPWQGESLCAIGWSGCGCVGRCE